MKSKVALVVAIALAILTAIGIKAYLLDEQKKYAGSTQEVTVLVATRDVTRGEVLKPGMVDTKKVPEQVVQDRRAVFDWNLNSVVGRPLQMGVKEDDILYWSYFKVEDKGEDPAAGLDQGYRAITIPVDKVTGCAGRLLPRSTVDVLVTLRLRSSPNAPIEPVTQTVLTGVMVLATDLYAVRPYQLSGRQRREFAAYSTVTLRATPLQANVLAFLAEQGKMHLVIRASDDPTQTDPGKIDKVTMDNLDQMIKKAVAEGAPKAPAPPD